MRNYERSLNFMDVLQPDDWPEALAMKAAHPEALPVAGGTDVMVGLNFGHLRPAAVLDLTRVSELAEWTPLGGALRIGAGVTYAQLISEVGEHLPGLAIAARTVGSPQIRNRATVGGNLGTSSPAGDGLPPLFAADAEVELASATGTRRMPVQQFVTGPKRNALAADELIAAFHVRPATGPQQFAKIGSRNAMVIAVGSLALALWPERRAVTACIGSAGPTPLRAAEAEAFAAAALEEHGMWTAAAALPPSVAVRFGELVAQAAQPIDDLRGTAAYRRHALAVLARRTLNWAWEAHRCG